jgi:hypothetical protein
MEDIFARIHDVVSFCSSAEATLEKVSDALVTMLRDYEASQGLEILPLKVEQPGENNEIEVQHGVNERPLDKVRGLTLKRLKKFSLRGNYV